MTTTFNIGDAVRFRKDSPRRHGRHYLYAVDRISPVTGSVSLIPLQGQPDEARSRVIGRLFEPRDLVLAARAKSPKHLDPADFAHGYITCHEPSTEFYSVPAQQSPVPAAQELVDRAAQTFRDAQQNLKRAKAQEAEQRAQERREAAARAKAKAEAEKAEAVAKERADKLTRYNLLLIATRTALIQIGELERGKVPGPSEGVAAFKAELAPLAAEFGYRIVTANGQGTVAHKE